jgi:hypothetical protein
VVGELIVGEDGAGNNVRSHRKTSAVGCAGPVRYHNKGTWHNVGDL